MTRTNHLVVIVALGVSAWVSAGSVRAAQVLNAGFESPDTATFTNTDITDWEPFDSGDTLWGVIDEGDGSVPDTPEGTQAAWLDGRTGGAAIYSPLGTSTFLSNWTLSLQVGDRSSLDLPSYTFGIWEDTDSNSVPDLPLATRTDPVTPDDEFLPSSVTAEKIGSGRDLFVVLEAAETASAMQVLFDDLQLDITVAVPEPSGFVLLLPFALCVLRGRDARQRDSGMRG